MFSFLSCIRMVTNRAPGKFLCVTLLTFLIATRFASAEFTYDWIPIGDPGNIADDNGYGAVQDEYQIGRYEVTNAEYVEFLNSVARTDPNDLYIYKMTSWPGGGILRSGNSGSYEYSARPGWEQRPAVYVTWWSSLRLANWIQNGQPEGLQDATTTEDGAYTLNQDIFENLTVVRNSDAKVFVPTDAQWYKAAYYKTGGIDAGYFDYPTSSDEIPESTDPPGSMNAANYDRGQDLTDVGAYSLSASPYGTYDQAGNVWEWTEDIGSRQNRSVIIRGGASPRDAERLAADWRQGHSPDHGRIGLRLATLINPWLTGDFNSNGVLSVADLDEMELFNDRFDVTGDGIANESDIDMMVEQIIGTWLGDADGDGEFNTSDWVHVFTQGKYETREPAVWTEGDWNFDGAFDSSDLIAAFAAGGYDRGPRIQVAPVPEPATMILIFGAIPCIGWLRRSAR